MISAIESNHFTSYKYYSNLYSGICKDCSTETPHMVLRFQTYFSSKHPIIPTRNTYYLVCSECGLYEEIEDELMLIKLLHKSKGQSPTKYDKNSFLDIKVSNEDVLKHHILVHLNDMSKHD